jgi:anaerobic selenocysteine-containing dehydrogenase
METVEAARVQIAQNVPIYDFLTDKARLAKGEPWQYEKVAPAGRHKLSLVVEGRPAADDTYSFVLTFDSMLHYGGSVSLHSRSLAKLRVDEAIEISEDDAKALGVENGAPVVVKTKNGGSVKLPALISEELPPRVVSVPSHNYRAVQALIGKLDASVLRDEEGAPAWVASVMPAKG